MPTGALIVKEQKTVPGSVALYARVSSNDQKKDLEAQRGRLSAFAGANGWSVSKTVTEIASRLNGQRPKLGKLLPVSGVSVIVVEQRETYAFWVRVCRISSSGSGQTACDCRPVRAQG